MMLCDELTQTKGKIMLVWHVIQNVKPGHNTSYKTGFNWIESHDREEEAKTRAEKMNNCRSCQCIGVEYVVMGPVDESEPINDFN